VIQPIPEENLNSEKAPIQGPNQNSICPHFRELAKDEFRSGKGYREEKAMLASLDPPID
jgi:hypothetical protein